MSNYKISGIDLDQFFEPRLGRTPLASATGYKVGGVDLNDRYLNITHGDAIVGPDRPFYNSSGVNLGTLFGARASQPDTPIYATPTVVFPGWVGPTFTCTCELTFASEADRDKAFLYLSMFRVYPDYVSENETDPAGIMLRDNLWQWGTVLRYTSHSPVNYNNLTTSNQELRHNEDVAGNSCTLYGRKSGTTKVIIDVIITTGLSGPAEGQLKCDAVFWYHTSIGITAPTITFTELL